MCDSGARVVCRHVSALLPSPSPAGAPAANSNGAAPPPAPTLGVELPSLPGSKARWPGRALSAAEHIALAPFEAQWDSFSDERKRKWLKIASRYSKLSPEAQKRLHDRMTEWVRMAPDQRRVARENYQVSKQLPREARQNAWKAYQELPEEQKQSGSPQASINGVRAWSARRRRAAARSRASTGW